MMYAQFFDKRDGWTVNLRGVDYTYKGDILSYGKELYFSVIYISYLGSLLALHVFDGDSWASVKNIIFT